METHLADWMRDTADGIEAERILRACVHCGFCTATCPTYQQLGDELDGPRGRIYLIKQLLEGQEATARTRLHLDRCLSCRACETTCPSGVKYHRLLDIGRHVLSERLPRPLGQRLFWLALAEGLTRPRLFATAVRLGQLLRPLLPAALGNKLPAGATTSTATSASPAAALPAPHATHSAFDPAAFATGDRADLPTPRRRVMMLAGCVQPALAPSINEAARRVLAALGIAAIEAPKAGCCGALRHHLDQQADALDDMRRLIDHWWPFINNGAVEAIIVTASGCGAQIKDYGHLLRNDPDYADQAARISALCRDVGDYLGDHATALTELLRPSSGDAPEPTNEPAKSSQTDPPEKITRVAVHTPCTLQHALQRRGDIERLLDLAGYHLTPVGEGHLCCGSAGTYSLLQPELATALRDRKLAALTGDAAATDPDRRPQLIVTANIGCLGHLQSGTTLPVRHWVELLADHLP